MFYLNYPIDFENLELNGLGFENHIPHSQQDLYIFCKTGKRSCKAILSLHENGIDAVNLEGGITAWDNNESSF